MSMFSMAFSSVQSALARWLGEGVEVDHQHVDGLDAVFLQGRHVLGQVAAGQEAAVHTWGAGS